MTYREAMGGLQLVAESEIGAPARLEQAKEDARFRGSLERLRRDTHGVR